MKTKVGIDYHEVITKYPEFFSELSIKLLTENCEVHILTGQSLHEIKDQLGEYQMLYSHFFSIVDTCFYDGSDMARVNGRWQLDDEIWIKAKGKYATEVGLDVHFDDNQRFLDHMPHDCRTILVDDNFPNIADKIKKGVFLNGKL